MSSIDFTKLDARTIEEKATQGSRFDESAVKRAGFERRMDRVNEALKNPGSEKELKRLEGVRKYTLEKYNKYHNKQHKS